MIDGGVHRFPIRVYYEDTDFSGFVYHANYLKFLERARTELIRELGMDQRAMFDAEGGPTHFVVSGMRISWKRPARMDDLLTIETWLHKLGGATFEMAQRIVRGAEELVTAELRLAVIGNGRARRLPSALAEVLRTVVTPRPSDR